jgi:surfeit locus 1 family protein
VNNDSGPERTAGLLAITPAGVAGTVLLIVVVAACVRLGFWQLARLDERRALNAGIAARLEQQPIRDISQISDTAGTAYRTATARGLYDNDRYVVLPGRAYTGVPGIHLIMPLRLAGRAGAVLVNRGWIPAPDAATINARDFAVLDSVTVRGLVLPFPGSGQSLARRDATRPGATFTHVLYRIDEAELRAQFPYALADVLLQELDGAGGPRYPTQLAPPPLDEGPHLGYALQWFAFAVIGVIGWFALVLHRRPTRRIATSTVPLMALIAFPASGTAQLRPLEPLEWRVFDDNVQLIADAGIGVLWGQPAPLAGTRGTLIELGNYSLTVRSARIAVQLGGAALWRLTEHDTLRAPAATVEPSDGVRQDAGGAFASTAIRFSPDHWPADLVLRFGATVPTTSDESGLDRDRTDFFALIGARYRRGDLSLMAENGVGINGTIMPDLPQSDVWTYAFGAAYGSSSLRLAADFVGRQDGHAYVIRGNEDIRELRAGFDIGSARWLRVRYVRGFDDDASPAHGLRISGGIRLYGAK